MCVCENDENVPFIIELHTWTVSHTGLPCLSALSMLEALHMKMLLLFPLLYSQSLAPLSCRYQRYQWQPRRKDRAVRPTWRPFHKRTYPVYEPVRALWRMVGATRHRSRILRWLRETLQGYGKNNGRSQDIFVAESQRKKKEEKEKKSENSQQKYRRPKGYHREPLIGQPTRQSCSYIQEARR